jgi:mono/diheme cytochrome c family protein
MTHDRRGAAGSCLSMAALLLLAGSGGAALAQAAKQPLSTPPAQGQTANLPPKSATVVLPPEGETAGVPIGDFAGGAQPDLAALIQNPASGDDAATGHMLYIRLNCADCHGFKGKGGMGPNLTDRSWIFGGTPAQIFKSIYEGRPEGMPSWGKALPRKDIWQLVAFIQTLGGSDKPSEYRASLQGDTPNELTAPDLNFLQKLNGSPPYPKNRLQTNPTSSQASGQQQKK